jgi:hypothetical protein
MAQVNTGVSQLIREVPPAAVFERAVDPAVLCEVFTGFGPVPAIRSIEFPVGATLGVGMVRRVVLGDGSELAETILQFDPANRHTYRVTGYEPPFSWLTREAIGDWVFLEEDGGTRVVWLYSFRLTTPLVYPLAAMALFGLMRPAMGRALANLAALPW